jgi:signal transduction histidine kinase
MPPKILSRLSFRLQVLTLGTLVGILFLAVLFAAFAALRFTKSSVLTDEQNHLLVTTRALAAEYSERAALASQKHEMSPLDDVSPQSSSGQLSVLSNVILQNSEEIKAGFYSRTADSLEGYSVSDGTPKDGTDGDSFSDQRAAILRVAREATLKGAPAESVQISPRDVILIEAVPVRNGDHISGSAWTFKQVPSLPGENRLRAYLIIAVLGLAALVCVFITFLVVRNLQSGVLKIEGGLEHLERDLNSQIPIGEDPGEIKRIASGINRLGAILREKIAGEKRIADRLRHAERLAALGRLVAGVAHEVRNPLTTIRLRIQMCQQSSFDPLVHESCGIALEEIERLNGMVNRLLNFSQPIHLHVEPTNLRALLEQRLESFADRARLQGTRFVKNGTNDGKIVSVDQSRLAQVFDNVVQNALEAMAEGGGTLCTTVSSQNDQHPDRGGVCVELNDTGTGIGAGNVSKVFDPFFTTKATGTGLGLSICHELVRAHGGEIQILSGNGCGTTVRIWLPLDQSRSHDSAE